MANDQFGYGGASKDNTEHQNPEPVESERTDQGEEGSNRGDTRSRGNYGEPNYAGSRYGAARGGQGAGRGAQSPTRGAPRRGSGSDGDASPRNRGGGPSRRQSGGPSGGRR
jgi:hypothetical protein